MSTLAKVSQFRQAAWRPLQGAAREPYALDEANGHEVESQLPEPLPAGERILWHGGPRPRLLALRALHTRKLAIYFAALMLWRALTAWSDGASVAESVWSGLWMGPIAGTALGLLVLLAWAMARTTLYTITNRRVLMRIGVALPITVNIPFRIIEQAGMKRHRDGSGDIELTLREGDRIAYLHLWPHARPWRFARPRPTLRGLTDVQAAAQVLSRALEREMATSRAAAPEPAPGAPMHA